MKRNALIIAELGSGQTRSVTTTIDEAFTLDVQQLRRERGLRSKNEARQQAAKRDYQKYRGMVQKLYAQNPQAKRWRAHKLAKAVQAELIKRGETAPSIRTLERAFGPKK